MPLEGEKKELNNMEKLLKKLGLRSRISKGERLIYVIIILWLAFGILGIIQDTNLTQLAGYYASLTLFISTYLWGEWKRSSTTTTVFVKGENSSREVIIYITVLLWTLTGAFGIFYMTDINPLTVYFSSLSPFVMSYIIYKTSKGSADLPIFDGKTQELIDNSKNAADITKEGFKKKGVVDPNVVDTSEIDAAVVTTDITPEENVG